MKSDCFMVHERRGGLCGVINIIEPKGESMSEHRIWPTEKTSAW